MTRASLQRRALTGETELSTPGVSASSACSRSNSAMFSAVNSSTMLWPSGTSNAVSIASPPKRSWYASLSIAISESELR